MGLGLASCGDDLFYGVTVKTTELSRSRTFGPRSTDVRHIGNIAEDLKLERPISRRLWVVGRETNMCRNRARTVQTASLAEYLDAYYDGTAFFLRDTPVTEKIGKLATALCPQLTVRAVAPTSHCIGLARMLYFDLP